MRLAGIAPLRTPFGRAIRKNADDIKVCLTYNNADGSEIYSCEFE